MRYLLLWMGALLISPCVFGQGGMVKRSKPVVDTTVFNNWSFVGGTRRINADGSYIGYVIVNKSPELVIRSLQTNWEKRVTGFSGEVSFSSDSRLVYYQVKDSLYCLELGTSRMRVQAGITRYKLLRQGAEEWLLYQAKMPAAGLYLRREKDHKEVFYAGVEEYYPDALCNTLLLVKPSSSGGQGLYRVKLGAAMSTPLWEGAGATGFTFDGTGGQLAFVVNSREEGNSLWYSRGDEPARRLLSAGRGIEAGWALQNIHRFTGNGQRLLVRVKEPTLPKARPGAVLVDVWNYRDVKLQSQQLEELKGARGARDYLFVADLTTGGVRRVEQAYEQLSGFVDRSDESGNWVLLEHLEGEPWEARWNARAGKTLWLVSLVTGQRRAMVHPDGTRINQTSNVDVLSPGGRYVTLKDSRGDICSYGVADSSVHNLTAGIPRIGPEDPYWEDFEKPLLYTVAGEWSAGDRYMLIHDKYDIWQVDPSGRQGPVNLTNGYGRRHHLIFSIVKLLGQAASGAGLPDTWYLSAFSMDDKTEGFYLPGRRGRDPEKLIMSAADYETDQIIQASGAGVWLLMRNSQAGRNLLVTRDFKAFRQLTDIHPERNYNWFTAELHHWQLPSGRATQGVLYKPEDFDPSRSYPVLIHYYENEEVNQMYHYKRPDLTASAINIPWFVSRGYLVFIPDIYCRYGYAGQSAYDAVMSGVDHLKQYAFVDTGRLGLQGHSFGGYETNYLVTHTGIFKAAMSSSGVSDFLAGYLYVDGKIAGGASLQSFYEWGQYRLGKSLWEDPEAYLRNSPVMQADKVTTPLLLMNNKEDGGVPFLHGTAFFTALRRLGKKVWMLQYDGENHNLHKKASRLQHTIRVTQFFDHYLKGAAAPLWMTRGIPARLKGIEDGLGLDSTSVVP